MLIYRKDLNADNPRPGGWQITSVGDLRALLNRLEIPDDWEIWPNKLGNLALFQTTTRHPDGFMRYYVGYIDMATMQVKLKPVPKERFGTLHGVPEDTPGYPDQWPFADRHITADGTEGHDQQSERAGA
jgi:hypothetical protein